MVKEQEFEGEECEQEEEGEKKKLTIVEKLKNATKKLVDGENEPKNIDQASRFIKACLIIEHMTSAGASRFIRNDIAEAFRITDKVTIKELLDYYKKEMAARMKENAERVEREEREREAKKNAESKGIVAGNDSESNDTYITFGEQADKAAYAIKVLAEDFINRYVPVFSIGEDLYVYKDGVYSVGETTFEDAKNFIYNLAGAHGNDISPTNAKNVLKRVIDMTAISSKDLCNAPERVVINNGILDVTTNMLYPHNPNEKHIAKINITYDGNVQITKQFQDYLNSTFKGYEWEIELVQELFGYCLYRGYPIEKFFFLIGDGENGKSVLINVLTEFLGSSNVTSLRVHDVCKPRDVHELVGLRGKFASLCGETGTDDIDNTGNLKLITGKDDIQSRDLYTSWVKFKNYAKFIASMNKPPVIKDKTRGARRRMETITFPNIFEEGKDAIVDLELKLTTPESLTGMLNWALVGLQRLLKNNKFTDPRTMATINMEYDRKSSPVKAFVEAHIDAIEIYGDDKKSLEEYHKSRLTYGQILMAYTAFSKAEKLPTLALNDLIKSLTEECSRFGYKVSSGRDKYKTDKDGKPLPRDSFVKGIKLVNVEKYGIVLVDSVNDTAQKVFA